MGLRRSTTGIAWWMRISRRTAAPALALVFFCLAAGAARAVVVLPKGSEKPVMGYLVREDERTIVLRQQQAGEKSRERVFSKSDLDELIVTVSPERLTIRRAGGNVTYPIDELPAGLTMALADSWFKSDDPVNRVVKGAYFAVAEGDVASHREKAKKYWEEATAAGVDAKPLLPFLTDKYDLEMKAEATKTDKGDAASESEP